MNYNTFLGEIIGSKQETISTVRGAGGGSYNTPVNIWTTHDTVTSFFVRSENGHENNFSIAFSLPIRDGQKVKILTVDGAFLAIDNYSMKERFRAPGIGEAFAGKQSTKMKGASGVVAFVFFSLIFWGLFAEFAYLTIPEINIPRAGDSPLKYSNYSELHEGVKPHDFRPDLSLVAGLGAALLIRAIINGRHSVWQKKVDNYEREIGAAIEKYL